MRMICLLLVGFTSVQVFSKSSDDCQELKSEQIRLALTASNLANVNTTRTPEGGAYRPYIIRSCSNGGCDVSRDIGKSLIKYLPGHPDADKNGYVTFPNIDVKSEYAIFNMTAIKLKLLAIAKACNAKVLIDNGNESFALRYNGKGQKNVKEDIFNFTKNHEVVSWSRQGSKGQNTVINFSSTGRPVSYTKSE
ncbi:MAG: flagellar basal body rod protein FlgC [Pseudobdellovibrionaceae bacterium]